MQQRQRRAPNRRVPGRRAVLLTVGEESDQITPFWGAVATHGLGEDFVAYGYPESIFGSDARQPTPRLFKGHYQRFLHYRSFMGYHYDAGELSIGVPAGLS